MHAELHGDDEPMAQMNFIPLIDIALTLVIILMVTTVLIKKPGVQLKLPETRTQEGAPETPKDLIVAIGRDGRYYIDGEALPAAAIQARLTAANLFHVQVSDVAGVPRELMTDSDRVMPGEGDFRLEPVMARLKEIGYASGVSLELMNPVLWQLKTTQVVELGMTALHRLLT